MGSSLLDQLRKSGLVDEKQARQAGIDKRRAKKQGAKARKGARESPEAQAQRAARAAAAEKAERDRALERERQATAAKRALGAEIRQLIETHREPRDDDGVEYRFADGATVRGIRLPDPLRRKVIDGRMAIVRLGDGFEIVAAAVAARIAERDPAAVVVHHERSGGPDPDDPYAGYEVPDDLTW